MGEFASMFTREPKPFEREAQIRVRRELSDLGLVEPRFYAGQVELKAKVDTLRDLRHFADQYGGEIETEPARYVSDLVKAFTVVEIQGIKVHICAYLSEEESEESGLW